MAIMYPQNISEYMPTDSERIVYHALKTQLPDDYQVFYSVEWTTINEGTLDKSEADFIVVSPDYGFLCLEVKGGSKIVLEDGNWYVEDTLHGSRSLSKSPYEQAEKSMYYFKQLFSNMYNAPFTGIFGAGVVFPFYSIDANMVIDHRQRSCTIESSEMNELFNKIKKMFRIWAGDFFGRRPYRPDQHEALLNIIRERIALSAAAGALIKYKEQQLAVINRIQDNLVYFLSNVRQFYIRGGAGTGKTWIAMKMAKMQAVIHPNKVLFLCTSEYLAKMVKRHIGESVCVSDIKSFFESNISNFNLLAPPFYEGVSDHIKTDAKKYDAIFVDEAQDFTVEWAAAIRSLLEDQTESVLGVFYDDVQVLREDSFGEGFGISTLPYLLHENIRNTANIYNWTSNKTNLGRDMIANPVEGPTPTTEYVSEKGQMTLSLESIFHRFLHKEHLPCNNLVIITDDANLFMEMYPDGIAAWKFVLGESSSENTISVYTVEEFKGLECNMVVYIHADTSNANINYIAYTRAKYYLIELVRVS